MTDLSPAAQAVLNAFRAVPDLRDCPSIAGALRAAADQLVPPNDPCMLAELKLWCRLRRIADELEGGE